MIYAAELFYLQDRHDIPFRKVVLVTARTLAQWCSHFRVRLLSPAQKYTGLLEKHGPLPIEPLERDTFIAELIQWLFDYSTIEELFCLYLDDRAVPQEGRIAKFHHPDDTCCWFLNLTEGEFAILQDAWRRNDLPANLFYPEHETRYIPYPGHNLKSKVLRVLSVQKCYTPMQWQAEFSQIQQETAG